MAAETLSLTVWLYRAHECKPETRHRIARPNENQIHVEYRRHAAHDGTQRGPRARRSLPQGLESRLCRLTVFESRILQKIFPLPPLMVTNCVSAAANLFAISGSFGK